LNITNKREDFLDGMEDERLTEKDDTLYIYRENGTWGEPRMRWREQVLA
jgi:hypothetical protein